ncbi:lipase maturation factor family protein [Acidobacteria bacterium AB60]|nr:lipase maturation factor family protein [Acidobacteria bacterium AB60]
MRTAAGFLRRIFDGRCGADRAVLARWTFLRALALIYFSAFYSLLFQIKGLIGPHGILPAKNYLEAATQYYGTASYWHAPSLFWLSSSSMMMMTVTWCGIAASLLAFVNVWPRMTLLACFVCFLSFVSAAGDFSSYQSDGMLLEAGFLALLFAPGGVWPGLGARHLPSRASLWLLRWEWFRIYFESGLVKELSGDPQWRNFTAMDEYYQNSPLPTWIGFYAQHLPHWFHAASAVATLVMELVLVFLLFFPRRLRLICFCIVTPWEIGVILTGNYAFLNFIVLALGFLLVDDVYWRRVFPARFRPAMLRRVNDEGEPGVGAALHGAGVMVSGCLMIWVGYATTAELVNLVVPHALPIAPAAALEPFRIANQYGLFAVMTRGRYEIEFQGSRDGQNWEPYVFRYKPQLLHEAPGIYAPYQPRFDWNLWFASLGDWQQNEIVPITETRLLSNDRDVLALFRSSPFDGAAPRAVRAVLYQYWFTSLNEKRRTGNWWRRQFLGLYAPALERTADGHYGMIAPADQLPPHD